MKQPKPRKKQKYDELYYDEQLGRLEICLLNGDYEFYGAFWLKGIIRTWHRESFIKDKHYTFIGEIK